MSINFASRVTIPADVMVQELHGESVLLNIRTGKYFGLDEVGTCMWRAMTAAPRIQAATVELSKEYDVHAEQLGQDILELAAKLVHHGLLEVQGE
jgi:hypothetical protein